MIRSSNIWVEQQILNWIQKSTYLCFFANSQTRKYYLIVHMSFYISFLTIPYFSCHIQSSIQKLSKMLFLGKIIVSLQNELNCYIFCPKNQISMIGLLELLHLQYTKTKILKKEFYYNFLEEPRKLSQLLDVRILDLKLIYYFVEIQVKKKIVINQSKK